MSRAVELAWESFCAGSLGIGAVVTHNDDVVVTGRNRLAEHDAGDDVLAGTSLAHAEMNALAKLRWGLYRNDHLVLWTTLEPCLQCLGAIRLSAIKEVRVLAPDPLFRAIHRGARTLSPFIESGWPLIVERPADEWAVFGLLLQTHIGVFWNASVPGWNEALPSIAALATDLIASAELLDMAAATCTLTDVVEQLWSRLGGCVGDVVRLASAEDFGAI